MTTPAPADDGPEFEIGDRVRVTDTILGLRDGDLGDVVGVQGHMIGVVWDSHPQTAIYLDSDLVEVEEQPEQEMGPIEPVATKQAIRVRDLKIGDRLRHMGDGKMATVMEVLPGGIFRVQWDEPDTVNNFGVETTETELWGGLAGFERIGTQMKHASNDRTLLASLGISAAVEVITREYENTHSKKPRGWGTWAFEIAGNDGPFWVYESSYADAKKQAQEKAKELGAYSIKVLP